MLSFIRTLNCVYIFQTSFITCEKVKLFLSRNCCFANLTFSEKNISTHPQLPSITTTISVEHLLGIWTLDPLLLPSLLALLNDQKQKFLEIQYTICKESDTCRLFNANWKFEKDLILLKTLDHYLLFQFSPSPSIELITWLSKFCTTANLSHTEVATNTKAVAIETTQITHFIQVWFLPWQHRNTLIELARHQNLGYSFRSTSVPVFCTCKRKSACFCSNNLLSCSICSSSILCLPPSFSIV